MGKGGKTVNHKAKAAMKATVKATAPAPATSSNDGSIAASNKTNKKQEKSMKSVPQAGLKARESDERKTALRNKIEVKRLLSHLQKSKDLLEGKEDNPKIDEWKYRVGKWKTWLDQFFEL